MVFLWFSYGFPSYVAVYQRVILPAENMPLRSAELERFLTWFLVDGLPKGKMRRIPPIYEKATAMYIMYIYIYVFIYYCKYNMYIYMYILLWYKYNNKYVYIHMYIQYTYYIVIKHGLCVYGVYLWPARGRHQQQRAHAVVQRGCDLDEEYSSQCLY